METGIQVGFCILELRALELKLRLGLHCAFSICAGMRIIVCGVYPVSGNKQMETRLNQNG